MLQSKQPIYLALIHYPVMGRQGETISTSITTFDIHDIARTCRTYGIKKYFIVTPIESQQWLAGRIIDHWQKGVGAEYNPSRKEAFEIIKLCHSLDEVCSSIQNEVGKVPKLIGTSAKLKESAISYEKLKSDFLEQDRPQLLLFGTGWGMAEELLAKSDAVLMPIGQPEYNHLSVRAAVAIILDRLSRN